MQNHAINIQHDILSVMVTVLIGEGNTHTHTHTNLQEWVVKLEESQV